MFCYLHALEPSGAGGALVACQLARCVDIFYMLSADLRRELRRVSLLVTFILIVVALCRNLHALRPSADPAKSYISLQEREDLIQ